MELKLFGAIYYSKATIPHMHKRNGGAVVNLTASLAKTPSESSLPTNVSRSAGMAMTGSLSIDLERNNIRVNTVYCSCPQ